MKRTGKTNYAYAVARVQAKRAKLISPADYDKILKMDVSEITRFIEDSHYKAEVDELSTRFTGLDLLEAALTVNQERTHQQVRHLVDGEGGELISLWLMRHWLDDLKTVMRGKQGGASREELLKELLLEDLDTYNVFDALLAEEIQSPQEIAATLRRLGGPAAVWAKVLESVPADSGPAAFEDALDKAYFANLLLGLHDSKQKGASQVELTIRREIDGRNLQNAARWVANKQSADFSPFVIPGGKSVSVATAVKLSQSADLAAFAEGATELGLPETVMEALAASQESGRLAPFQSALQKWHAKEQDKLRAGAPLSILPILLFLARKDREVVTLRAVARGKAAGLSQERLQEMI